MKQQILIFGTGSVAEVLVKEISENVEILAFINSNLNIQEFHGYKVISPEKIDIYEYDYIIVASGYYMEIEKRLLSLGIEKEKIVGFIFDETASYLEMSDAIGDFLNTRYNRDVMKNILKTDKLYPQICASVLWKNNGFRRISKDFVREQIMILIAQEIERKNILGAVAELGVFRGDFTVVISEALPKRKLYLFDTFCGFEDADVQMDDNVQNKANEMIKFKNTSEEYVLSRLGSNRSQSIVKKGWFPDTFDLYDESFCFVSIDMNMYNPVLEALNLFVPRVNRGGYILISDFHAPFYEGTQKAIIDFCDREGLNFLPLPDLYGSAVICK